MSKKAIFGGLLMLLFVVGGLFGKVTFNGEIVENKFVAVVVSAILLPLAFVIFGFMFGFIQQSICAFFREMKNKFTKKTVSPQI